MTLWHLGHNAELIERFHASVKAQGMTPEKLLPAVSLTPPGTMTRMLVEPELLGTAKLNGWQVDNEAITSGAGDSGPTVSIPVRVPKAG